MLKRKAKISQQDIEKIVCDGKNIIGIDGLTFIGKNCALASAIIPSRTEIQTACDAMNAASKRAEYAFNISLILRPLPTIISNNSEGRYKETAELIISDINKDFEIIDFHSDEDNEKIIFSFELLVPKEYEKNNAELLIELKSQFRKLSNKIIINAMIIRNQKNKAH